MTLTSDFTSELGEFYSQKKQHHQRFMIVNRVTRNQGEITACMEYKWYEKRSRPHICSLKQKCTPMWGVLLWKGIYACILYVCTYIYIEICKYTHIYWHFSLISVSLNLSRTQLAGTINNYFFWLCVLEHGQLGWWTAHTIGHAIKLIPAVAAGSWPPIWQQESAFVRHLKPSPWKRLSVVPLAQCPSVTRDPSWHLWNVKLLPAADWACPSFTHGRVLKEIKVWVIPDWGQGMYACARAHVCTHTHSQESRGLIPGETLESGHQPLQE